MRIHLTGWLAVISLSLTTLNVYAEIQSQVIAATVYEAGVTIQRQARVDIEPGEQTLVLDGIPANSSLHQVAFLNAPEIKVGQVSIKLVERSDAVSAEVEALEEQIYKQRQKLAGLLDTKQTADLKLQFLAGVAKGYAQQGSLEAARGQADPTTWVKALDVLAEGDARARQERRHSDEEIKRLQQHLDQLERQLARLNGDLKQHATLHISVDRDAKLGANKPNYTLLLSYFQNDAHWHAKMEGRLDTESKTLQLAQKAVVVQRTNENWQNIKLTLSTSTPSGELQPPALLSQFVGIKRPEVHRDNRIEEVVVTGVRKRRSSRDIPELAFSGAPVEELSVDIQNYGVNYTVPGRVNVSNISQDEQIFDLTAHSVAVDLLTQIVPSLSNEAFLIAKFRHQQDEPLYANALSIFVDGTFVGETEIENVLPGMEVELPMGRDRGTSVQVRHQGNDKDVRGIVGRRSHQRSYVIFELGNQRNSAKTVEVLGRLPVPEDDSIKVEVPRDATAPVESNLDNRPGIVVWRKQLGPKENWRIHHKYVVSLPAGKQLSERFE